jgi:hypothetical protein
MTFKIIPPGAMRKLLYLYQPDKKWRLPLSRSSKTLIMTPQRPVAMADRAGTRPFDSAQEKTNVSGSLWVSEN